MSELTNGAKRRDGKHKSKKRTFDEANGDAAETNGTKARKLSKTEKREAKRLKKLEEGNGLDEKEAIQEQSALVQSSILQDAELNGILEGRKCYKEKRREARRLRKLEKARDQVEKNPVEEPPKESGNDKADKATAKLARKAERAKGKASRKALESTKKEINQQDSTTVAKSKVHAAYEQDSKLATVPQAEIDAFLAANHITIDDPTASQTLRPITQFSYLPSSTVDDPRPFASFKTPTPIQAAAWPFLLSGRDVIGVAETGSGKTLAFGVPCIRSITSISKNSKYGPPARAIIVSPTRELAVQIHSQIETLAKPASLPSVCVYGGVPKDAQRSALETAAIIVATPGRLNDLITEGSANLSAVKYLVLDEADRMLDKGFEDEIRKIISTTPATGRQTLMFTATWPPSVRNLAATFMTSPVHISIGANNPTGELRANTSIHQSVEVIDPRAKETRLLQILQKHHRGQQDKGGKQQKDRILIFALYKKEAARIENLLHRHNFSVAAIHGDMSQQPRQTSLDNFKSGSCPLLVATDVAARGLDIPSVKLVVNVTFPLTVEDYVHRIGRTGRAGAVGEAITLFTDHDKGNAGGLINVLKAAGQEVPEELMKFGTTVKKKGHEAYGAFYKDVGEGKKEGTKIRFD